VGAICLSCGHVGNALEGQSPLGHSRVGETQHSWKLNVDDFISFHTAYSASSAIE
jgi:hypothetical protein